MTTFQFLRKLSKLGAESTNSASILLYLSEKGGIPIGKLAKALGTSVSTTSTCVDGLQKWGWVHRQRVTPSDQRIVTVFLTETGAKFLRPTTYNVL